jgi:hypothetical protein
MIRNKFGSPANVFIIYTIESDVAFREVPLCVRFEEAMFKFGVHIRRDEVSNAAIMRNDS